LILVYGKKTKTAKAQKTVFIGQLSGQICTLIYIWILGMLLFDYAARKSGFYAVNTPRVDMALS
jgi:hypothetical protein